MCKVVYCIAYTRNDLKMNIKETRLNENVCMILFSVKNQIGSVTKSIKITVVYMSIWQVNFQKYGINNLIQIKDWERQKESTYLRKAWRSLQCIDRGKNYFVVHLSRFSFYHHSKTDFEFEIYNKTIIIFKMAVKYPDFNKYRILIF